VGFATKQQMGHQSVGNAADDIYYGSASTSTSNTNSASFGRGIERNLFSVAGSNINGEEQMAQFHLLDAHGNTWEFQVAESLRVQWLIALRIEIEWAHRVRRRDAQLEFGLLSAGFLESTANLDEDEGAFPMEDENDSGIPLNRTNSRTQYTVLQEAVKNNLWFLSLKAQESNFNKTNDLHIQSVIKNFEKDKEKELSELQFKTDRELLQKEQALRLEFERTLQTERAKWIDEIDILNRKIHEMTRQISYKEMEKERAHLNELQSRTKALKAQHEQEMKNMQQLVDSYRSKAVSLDTELESTKNELTALQLTMGAQNVDQVLDENTQLKEKLYNMNRDLTEQRFVFEKRIRKMEHDSSFVLENTIHQIENRHRLQMADLKYSLLKELQEKEVNMTLALSQQRCAMESKLIKLKFGFDVDQDEYAKAEGNFYSGDALKIAHAEIEELTIEKKMLVDKVSALEAQLEKEAASFQQTICKGESATISREHEEQWLTHVSQVFEDARKDAKALKDIISTEKDQIVALQSEVVLLKSDTQKIVEKRLHELTEVLEEKHRLEIERINDGNKQAMEMVRRRHKLNLTDVMLRGVPPSEIDWSEEGHPPSNSLDLTAFTQREKHIRNGGVNTHHSV